jgi:hypothetical protein
MIGVLEVGIWNVSYPGGTIGWKMVLFFVHKINLSVFTIIR